MRFRIKKRGSRFWLQGRFLFFFWLDLPPKAGFSYLAKAEAARGYAEECAAGRFSSKLDMERRIAS